MKNAAGALRVDCGHLSLHEHCLIHSFYLLRLEFVIMMNHHHSSQTSSWDGRITTIEHAKPQQLFFNSIYLLDCAIEEGCVSKDHSNFNDDF